MKLLKQKKEFHTVIRSAGSRSAFDVVAIGESAVLLCQVKTGSGSFKREREELLHLRLPYCAKAEVWLYHRGKWETIRIE